MHYVTDDGHECALHPHRRSMEGLRSRFDHRFPRTSVWIGRVAIVVLLAGLVVGLPQAAALISRIDLIADTVGTFTSPVTLPAWLNATLLVAGILAAIERAVTLRNHWFIDIDTLWLGD